jgi:hypothetical protein
LLLANDQRKTIFLENQCINASAMNGSMKDKKALFIFPERIEFIRLVESLSGYLLENRVSIVVLLDEHETDVLQERKIDGVIFRDLSDYTSKNALGILNEEMPSLIITDNDQEPIRGAFVITARKLNIPVLVLREMVMVSKPKFDQMFFLIFRKMGELPRIFTKYFFCFKSILTIEPSYFLNVYGVFKRFINHLSNPTAGEFADYILTNTVEDARLLESLCSRPRFVRAIGDPRFDVIVNVGLPERRRIREEINQSFKIPPQKRIILFLSSSQVEHGMWSAEKKKEVNDEILNLLSEFQNEADIIIKLHPVEKNIFPLIWKPNYDNFIHVTNFDVSKLIIASDLVITWVSTAMVNVVLARKPLIVIDFFNDGVIGGVLLSTQAIVDHGAALKAANGPELYHCTKQLLNDNHLLETLRSRQDVFHSTYLKTIDGKSTDRISEIILEIIGC